MTTQRDEYVGGRLDDRDDENGWREARAEWERQHAEDLALDVDEMRVSQRQMIDRWAAERAEVEAAAAYAGYAERAIVRDGWRTIDLPPVPRRVELHATYTAYEGESLEQLRAQLAAIGFDAIDIEDAA